ncbi:MAG: PA0069 family radical SAM protein [Rhodospirillales bacterium]|nr:PA0069 family radical SAM protein [Rhodospirillales bacterium]
MPSIIERKGRGAQSNRTGRYEREEREPADDGWESAAEPLPGENRTQVSVDSARKVITRNDSPNIGFDRSINPYRGCEHGCIYCFARPSHAYLGLSPGLDFETRLFAKPDAARILRKELARPRYRPDTLVLGANTDPYQPVEKRMEITRQILQVLAEAKHPTCIVSKSDLILRDLDILAPMAKERLVSVAISVTTLDRTLARRMEPRAATPKKRLAAIEGLAAAGVPVGTLFAPVIPALNEPELDAVLAAAAEAGAERAGYVLLRLPLDLKEIFKEWLETHYPDRKKRVLDLLRQAGGDRLYDSRFGHRQRGTGPIAEILSVRFKAACRRLDLKNKGDFALETGLFRAPARDGRQLALF